MPTEGYFMGSKQIGPRGPGAQLSRAQFATFSRRTTVRGPICQEPFYEYYEYYYEYCKYFMNRVNIFMNIFYFFGMNILDIFLIYTANIFTFPAASL